MDKPQTSSGSEGVGNVLVSALALEHRDEMPQYITTTATSVPNMYLHAEFCMIYPRTKPIGIVADRGKQKIADPSPRQHSPETLYHQPAASCRPEGSPWTRSNLGFGPSSSQQTPGLLANPPPPCRWQSSAMLSSQRRPHKTIGIFSSEECYLRVARRVSLILSSAAAFVGTGFLIILNSDWAKDQRQTFH